MGKERRYDIVVKIHTTIETYESSLYIKRNLWIFLIILDCYLDIYMIW
jgi:hypothetical protein